MKDKEYSIPNEYSNIDDDLEYSFPKQIEEFNEITVDNEFLNAVEDEYYPIDKKKTIIKKQFLKKAIFGISAATLLIITSLNLDIISKNNNIDNIDKEDIVDIKDSKEIVSTIEDYSLVGCWSNDTEFYRFLDNGYGYYYNGQYVSIINWEKSENDYHVYGGGITNIDSINHIIQYWSTDSISARTEDGLYLSSDKAGTLLYRPTESKYDDEFIVSLLNTPFSERIQGFWEISSTIKSSPKISDLGPSYFIFDGTNMISDIGSDSYSYYKHFEVPYTIKDDYLVIVKGEHNYEITSGNNTYSYIDDQFTIYYFLTFENEYLLADVFSGSHVLVKEDWPF